MWLIFIALNSITSVNFRNVYVQSCSGEGYERTLGFYHHLGKLILKVVLVIQFLKSIYYRFQGHFVQRGHWSFFWMGLLPAYDNAISHSVFEIVPSHQWRWCDISLFYWTSYGSWTNFDSEDWDRRRSNGKFDLVSLLFCSLIYFVTFVQDKCIELPVHNQDTDPLPAAEVVQDEVQNVRFSLQFFLLHALMFNLLLTGT